jgi:hypothetical protein
VGVDGGALAGHDALLLPTVAESAHGGGPAAAPRFRVTGGCVGPSGLALHHLC